MLQDAVTASGQHLFICPLSCQRLKLIHKRWHVSMCSYKRRWFRHCCLHHQNPWSLLGKRECKIKVIRYSQSKDRLYQRYFLFYTCGMPAVLVKLNPKSSGSWPIKRDKGATPDGACLKVFIRRIRKIVKCDNFVISVRPSVRMERLGCHRADFHEILHLSIRRNSVEKIRVSLKSGENIGYLIWRPACCTFIVISCWTLLRVRHVSDTSCGCYQITYFTCVLITNKCTSLLHI